MTPRFECIRSAPNRYPSSESTLTTAAVIPVEAAHAGVAAGVTLDQPGQTLLHDALTGLPNRVLLLDRLAHASARGRRSLKKLIVLFVDLDRFDRVNRNHGRGTGDELLIAVAGRLASLLTPSDTLARLSGDEFVIVCEDADTSAEGVLLGAQVEAALAQPFLLPSAEVRTTASVGVAYADLDDCQPECLLQNARTAMGHAKRAGGARLRIFDPRDTSGTAVVAVP
jgi:diguanylate cyclase (GGDEF)-like protein